MSLWLSILLDCSLLLEMVSLVCSTQAAAITSGFIFVVTALDSDEELCITKLCQVNPMNIHLFPFLVSPKTSQSRWEKKPSISWPYKHHLPNTPLAIVPRHSRFLGGWQWPAIMRIDYGRVQYKRERNH